MKGVEPRLEHVTCDLCGADAPAPVAQVRDRVLGLTHAFRLVRCVSCGLVYLDPRPVTEDLTAYYPPEEYYAYRPPVVAPDNLQTRWRKRASHLALAVWRGYPFLESGADKGEDSDRESAVRARPPLTPTLSPAERGGTRTAWQAILSLPLLPWRGRLEMVPRYRPHGRLLDVGCGSGAYLLAMRALGWEVHGVETDTRSVERAREVWALDVRQGPLELAGFDSGMFDVITLWHVLEHLPSPRRALAACHRLLKLGGQLMLEVPNVVGPGARLFRERWFHVDAPRHLYAFSPTTLRRILDETAFASTRVWPVANEHGLAGSLQIIWDERRGRSAAGTYLRNNAVIAAGSRLASGVLAWLGQGDCLRAEAVRT
ncbi:MAG: class I SAM-dependent methyltransferase [Anaerolineae bacterium]|nr:class I SAM-dependent methyltransferase [Anaerolineae bacterium]